MGKPEGIVENYLSKQAKAHGFLCFKFAPSGIRGVPDRICIGNGRTVFIECKSDVGHLKPQQKLRIKEMREHGAYVAVINTKKLVDQFFQKAITWKPLTSDMPVLDKKQTPDPTESFKNLDTAWVVILNSGYSKPPELIEVTLKRIGRRYVTDNHNNRYRYTDKPYCCESEIYPKTMLFTTKQRASDYIETHELVTKLSNLNIYKLRANVPLDDLRKAYQLLNR